MTPLVIQQSRLKLGVLAALFGALTLMLAVCAFVSAFLPELWAFLAISLFAPLGIATAIAAAASAAAFLKPGTITAEPRGIVYRTWRTARVIAWEDVADFVVFAPGSRLRSPGVELKTGARKFVSFGRNWEKTPEEIVEGLRDHGPASASPQP